nr:chloroplast ferredoxin-11 [Chlamydomonas sp. UWO 241]
MRSISCSLTLASSSCRAAPTRLPMVTVMLETPAGAVSKWEIESDVNLRQMIKDTGEVEMYHGMWAKSMNCGGGGSCGTCVVQVLEDKDGLLSERNEIEGKKLKGKPDSFRLACQTWVGDGTNSGTCKVRVGPKA